MAVKNSLHLPEVLDDLVAKASPDLLKELVSRFVNALMSAEADAICGAPWGEVSPERVNRRNGYRARPWDTRAGTVEVKIPKLRAGSYFPEWLLERRRRAETALVSVVATCYLLGARRGAWSAWPRRSAPRAFRTPRSTEMAKELDEVVEQSRNRPLERGPYRSGQADALVVKVREGGRGLHPLLATAWG